jgi:hypothetical protein
MSICKLTKTNRNLARKYGSKDGTYETKDGG